MLPLLAVLVSQPMWQVPGPGLPADFKPGHSNNNVAIAKFEGRLFMSFRTAPIHFAGKKTRIVTLSSTDEGMSWETENIVALGSDAREPFLYTRSGRLHLTFFQAGKNPTKFEPKRMLRTERLAKGLWTSPEPFGDEGEIPWEFKEHDGKLWMTSYLGNHYNLQHSSVDVRFQYSDDGKTWNRLATVYTGGVSEVAFDFDPSGDLWAVGRNEDGDKTGFGSQIFHAPAGDLGHWDSMEQSDPHRYDSPRMFEHDGELYLVARREVGKPDGERANWLPEGLEKLFHLATYWFRPKRSALYHLDRVNRRVEWIQDIPGCGDTAFPSILRTGPHTFLVANYSSPLQHASWPWAHGQVSPQGTGIYFIQLTFVAQRDIH